MQTLRDFEWIVIDDGSTDGSLDAIKSFARQAEFPITIISQENSGKHVAWNRAVALAKGDFFVPLDSDDSCIPQTLERFASLWSNIPEKHRNDYSGINVLCWDPVSNEIVGDSFPLSPMDSNNLDLQYIHKVRGEHWGCIRTDILKLFPFLAVEGSFFPENYIWFKIARRWKVRCVNEPLRLYYRDQPNHLASPRRMGKLRSIRCQYYYSIWHITNNCDYLIRDKREFLYTLINIWRLGNDLNISARRIFGEITDVKKRLLLLFFLPVGIMFSLIDKLFKRI